MIKLTVWILQRNYCQKECRKMIWVITLSLWHFYEFWCFVLKCPQARYWTPSCSLMHLSESEYCVSPSWRNHNVYGKHYTAQASQIWKSYLDLIERCRLFCCLWLKQSCPEQSAILSLWQHFRQVWDVIWLVFSLVTPPFLFSLLPSGMCQNNMHRLLGNIRIKGYFKANWALFKYQSLLEYIELYTETKQLTHVKQ